MTKKQKQIQRLANQMLKESFEAAKKNVEKALKSGAIDAENWDEKYNPRILPKAIVVAVLKEEANQHDCKGTTHEKFIKKESQNISLFI